MQIAILDNVDTGDVAGAAKVGSLKMSIGQIPRARIVNNHFVAEELPRRVNEYLWDLQSKT